MVPARTVASPASSRAYCRWWCPPMKSSSSPARLRGSRLAGQRCRLLEGSAMAHTFYLAPSGNGVGLTSLALGLVRALDNRGIRVAFYKPIGQHGARDTGPERSTYFIRRTSSLAPATPVPIEEAERLLSTNKLDELLEQVM